jgi:hypothetical protein
VECAGAGYLGHEREVRLRDVHREGEPEPSTDDGPGEDVSVEDAVRRGRWSGTPFVLLGSVAATIWLVVALVTAVVLLVWWLA